MRTSKPISTISYNTENFLKGKLEELTRNHWIADWMYIPHRAEKDEAKDHIHVYVEPNKMMDTMALADQFRELDPFKPDKPLGVMRWQSSKVDDWLLYVLHFEPYLASKMESREYVYKREDVRCMDADVFEQTYNHAMTASDWARRNQILNALTDGTLHPAELIANGSIPLNLASQVAAFDKMMSRWSRGEVVRRGKSHTPADALQAPVDALQAPVSDSKTKVEEKPKKARKARKKANSDVIDGQIDITAYLSE